MRPISIAGVLALGTCLAANSQIVPHTATDLAYWTFTGAPAIQSDAGGLTLPAGTQVSRVFGAGESVTGRVRFEAVLSAEPEDVVSVQVGGATLAFARVDESVVVFSAEREREREREREIGRGPAAIG